MSISPNIVIMTKAELLDYRDEWFDKGVQRGRFEERCDQSQAKATEGKAGNAEGTPLVRQTTTGTGLRVGAADAVQPATSEFMDVTAGETAPNRCASLVEALEFYADPFAWKKKRDPQDLIRIPDFYSELSFGGAAMEALAAFNRAVADTRRDAPGDTRLVSGVSAESNEQQPHAVSQGWKDIETAPKDGTHVFVCDRSDPSFPFSQRPPTVAHWFGPPDLPGLRAGGWYLSVSYNEQPKLHGLTHWMPLPAPPSPDNAKTGGVDTRPTDSAEKRKP